MEYSSNKSNRSVRSITISQFEKPEPEENSIIIEEKENDETTKYSGSRKKSIVLPEIKTATPTLKPSIKTLDKHKPAYYYSLQFERNKLGTISTRVIKETVNRIRKK